MKLAYFRHVLALSAALSLTAAGAAARPVAPQPRETETVDRSFPFNPDGRVRLRNFSGNITITGSNRGNVVLHAVRRAPRERLAHIRLDIQASESEISIQANKKDDNWDERENDVVETEFEIEVPQGVTLDVDAFSSDVRIGGVSGKQKLHTFSGSIHVEDGTGPLDVDTFSGDIEVNLLPSASGRIEFDSFSGSLKTDVPLTTSGRGRRRVSGNIGSGGGSTTFSFKTFSGDVRIK